MFTYQTLKKLFLLLFVLAILFQPVLPLIQLRQVVADDEFDPWCGSNCNDPDDDDDDDDDDCEGDDASCNNQCSAGAGARINLFTGEEIYQFLDLYLPGFVPLPIVHSYRNQSLLNNRFGYGWDLNFNQRLLRQSDGSAVIMNGQGGRDVYTFRNGVFTAPTGEFIELLELPNGLYEARTQDGSVRVFDADGKLVTIRDRFNNQIRLSYDPAGQLPIIGTSPYFRSQTRGVVGYDYQLNTITDTAGRTITFTYNADGRLATIQYGGNRQITYSYDTNDNLVAVVDEIGQQTTYRYEDSLDVHNLTSVEDASGQVLVTRRYDSQDRVSSEVVDGFRSSVNYTTGTGNTRTARYVNGRGDSSVYQFSLMGNTTQVRQLGTAASSNRVMNLDYNTQNQLTGARLAGGTAGQGRTVNYTYDTSGQVLSVASNDGRRLDNVPESAHYFQPSSTTNLVGGAYNFSYDSANNLDTLTTPLNHSYGFDWTAEGQLETVTDPLGNVTQFSYDTTGNLTGITDALNMTTTLGYDNLGQLAHVTDALNNPLTFTYDNAGQITTIVDALGETHTLTYDSRGNLISYTDPNSNAVQMTYTSADNVKTSTDAQGNTTTYTYDGAYNLTQMTDGNGLVTTYLYDELGRLTAIQRSNVPAITYRFNALSDLLEAVTPDMRLTYDYTNGLAGKPSEVRFEGTSGNPVDTSLVYDYVIPGMNVGQGLRWHSGLVYGVDVRNTGQPTLSLDYTYNPVMNVTGLTASGLVSLGYTFSYDNASRLTAMTPTSAGVQTMLGYDAADRIVTLTNSSPNGSTVFQDYTYQYDPVGNLKVVTDSVTGAVTQYNYDNLYQLTQAVLPGSITFDYTYDPAGNRLTSAANGVTTTFSHDAANQLISSTANGGTTYTYDRNGNLLARADSRGTTTYSWNGDDELVRVGLPNGTFVAYTYDALGRRSSRTGSSGSTTYYVYDGMNLVQELDASGDIRATYVHSQTLDHPLSMTRGGVTYYYLYDQLGSVIGLTDGTGTQVAAYRYDPWGNLISSSGSVENPFRFTGREWDAETGLYYYRTRYYDPEVGRFIQRDKLELLGGWNLYAYVKNNPINRYDPSGLVWKLVLRIPGAGVRAVRNLTRRQALRVYRAGQDVATDSTRAAKKLAKDASVEAGGGGKYVGPERHGAGAKHCHGLDAGGDYVSRGHIFIDKALNFFIIFGEALLDADGDGYIDEADIIELVNPIPWPIFVPDQFSNPYGPYGPMA